MKTKRIYGCAEPPLHKSKLLFEDPSDSALSRYLRIRAFARTTFCFVRPIKTLYVCTLLTSTHAICATNTPTIHVHRTIAIQKETTLQFRRTHLELPAHSSRTPTPTDKRSCSLTPDPGPRCAPEDSTVTQRKQSQQNYKTR